MEVSTQIGYRHPQKAEDERMVGAHGGRLDDLLNGRHDRGVGTYRISSAAVVGQYMKWFCYEGIWFPS